MTGKVTTCLIFAATVAQLAVATFIPGLDQFEGSAMFALTGGATLVLLPRPGGTHNENTAMSWAVDDVEQEVKQLESNGVAFEDYDVPGLKTVDHIASMGDLKSAWFKDLDGNVLCVHTPMP